MSDMAGAWQTAIARAGRDGCFDGPVELTVEVPVRACDVGGWTDTWFAGHGRVCSLAVEPGVTVTATAERGGGLVRFHLADYGIDFVLGEEPAEHRLLAEAVREAAIRADVDVELTIESAVPPGCALGTSAAVAAGVVAALRAVQGERWRPQDLAAAAHRAEAGRLGRESGTQDQAAAAHGGANIIDIPEYPRTSTRPIQLPERTWRALDERLLHVAYGTPHDSSAVHEEVIAGLRAGGPTSRLLDDLRALAVAAASTLRAGDVERYGAVLTAATEAQRSLHPALVSADALALIDLARSLGASGWKVNGAGGPGGSISVLCRDPAGRASLRDAAEGLGHRPLELRLAPLGARVVRAISAG
jgi:D-glycero-alpha-D-manno-heptose-7-phosphate kinase